jgi:hypothetical protein
VKYALLLMFSRRTCIAKISYLPYQKALVRLPLDIAGGIDKRSLPTGAASEGNTVKPIERRHVILKDILQFVQHDEEEVKGRRSITSGVSRAGCGLGTGRFNRKESSKFHKTCHQIQGSGAIHVCFGDLSQQVN